ncbi:MAG: FKBP-type peptidyl-prolyl cis-trans isomerase [Planctomycetaceae bacterium]
MSFKGLMLVVVGVCLAGCVESATRDGHSSTDPANGTAHVSPASATSSQPSTNSGENVEYQETISGLKYHIVNPGGARKPSVTSTVTCHYRGTLENGTEFDSSYKRNEPTSFPLGGVIAGWTEGLQLIGEGGVIDLIIPGDLAYGPRGIPGVIPPNATLHFHVELIKIK